MTTWSAIILRDGDPITGPVPLTRWEAASVLAQLVAGWTGGPVSVASAVLNDAGCHTPRPEPEPAPPAEAPEPQLTIYDHLEAPAS